MIKQKLKICSVCQRESVLWKSNPALCKSCATRAKNTLVQTEDGKEAKPFKQYMTAEIKKVSTRQQKLLAEYAKKRKEFLKNNRFCEAKWLNCSYLATTVHHSAGRLNGNLTNEKTFKALCLSCHSQVEIQVERAKIQGLTIDRLCIN